MKADYKALTIKALKEASRLTRAQLSVGPLRHLPGGKDGRIKLLKQMERDGILTATHIQGLGPPKTVYRLT